MSTPIDQTIARIRAGGIIAIVRGRYSAEQITAIADVLAAAGLTAMEITLNSPDALAAGDRRPEDVEIV